MRSVRDIFRSYAVLDAEGRHTNGTDKESNHHYGDAYERIIEEAFKVGDSHGTGRQQVRLMMEVGNADGASLLAWREVFPNAQIVGLDIHHSDRAHGERIEFHLGDATDQATCDRVAAGREFDMIVDDATHNQADLLRTLLYLYRYVRPGGLYVIEEFGGVQSARGNIVTLWPNAKIIGTCGPTGNDEPLVVLRRTP